nr:MAG TPA: hypothetical protein [Bacteriophage sp.]DAO84994.1 MAG TPA: hypothetical protein [Caudoviricetes sp.]
MQHYLSYKTFFFIGNLFCLKSLNFYYIGM